MMKKIIFSILIGMLCCTANAALTAGKVPVVQSGGTSPTVKDSDISDSSGVVSIAGDQNVSGKVAIGTTATPLSTLSVGGAGVSGTGIYGTAATYGVQGVGGYGVKGTGTGTGVVGTGTSNANGVYGYADGSGAGGYFGSASGPALYTTTGNVGIGTATPTHPLHVYNATTKSGMDIVIENGSAAAGLNIVGSGGYANFGLSGATTYIGSQNSLNSLNLAITSTGYVGLGNTTPSAKLHVLGTASSTGNADNALTVTGGASSHAGGKGGSISLVGGAGSGSTMIGGDVSLEGGHGNGTAATGGNINITGGLGNGTGADVGGSVYISPGASSGANHGNVMLGITSGGVAIGNVGIGTITPKATLEVDGSIYIPSANLTQGQALCMASTSVLGHCTSVVGVSGGCTCVAN